MNSRSKDPNICMKFKCCICDETKDDSEAVPRPSGRFACEKCMGDNL